MGTRRLDFAEFYRRSADECLRSVLVSVGDQDMARELVDEAFARAWASWRTVSKHPAPKAWVVRTALNANISRWRRRRREVAVPDPGLVADPAATAGDPIMNDSDLITAVRESVTRVHTATPVEQIVSRGRALRARRRLPVAAGALAAAAAAALTATALVPAGHHPVGPDRPAELAAWTVVKQPDGDVKVTIRQLRDPAALQSRLRTDGVPATVTFSGQMSRSCQRYLAGPVLNQVFTSSGSGRATVMIIHPSALPPGAGIAISPPVQPALQVAVGLVHTSPQCTGT